MREQGAAALVVVGVVALIMALTAVLAAMGAVLDARLGATTAADAAALAAAPVTFLPFGATGSPADEAARFASLNGARLLYCSCPFDPSFDARTVVVRVRRTVEVVLLGRFSAEAVDRAQFSPLLLFDGL